MSDLIQLLKVDTGEIDGDDSGRHWKSCYTLYQTTDDDGRECFDVYLTDEQGDGVQVARGYHHWKMHSMVLRLGTFMCYTKNDEEFRIAQKAKVS